MHRNLIDVMRARRKCERSGGRIVVSFLPLRFMGTVTARKEATKSVRLHSFSGIVLVVTGVPVKRELE